MVVLHLGCCFFSFSSSLVDCKNTDLLPRPCLHLEDGRGMHTQLELHTQLKLIWRWACAAWLEQAENIFSGGRAKQIDTSSNRKIRMIEGLKNSVLFLLGLSVKPRGLLIECGFCGA